MMTTSGLCPASLLWTAPVGRYAVPSQERDSRATCSHLPAPSSLSDLAVCSDQRERAIEMTPAAGPSDCRNMNRRWAAVLCVLLALGAGCTSTWTLRTDRPAMAHQWPYQPNKAKVTYVQSLSGLTRNPDSSSV